MEPFRATPIPLPAEAGSPSEVLMASGRKTNFFTAPRRVVLPHRLLGLVKRGKVETSRRGSACMYVPTHHAATVSAAPFSRYTNFVNRLAISVSSRAPSTGQGAGLGASQVSGLPGKSSFLGLMLLADLAGGLAAGGSDLPPESLV